MQVSVQFELNDVWIDERVKKPLQTEDFLKFDLNVNVYDAQKNRICTETTCWQVKPWDK